MRLVDRGHHLWAERQAAKEATCRRRWCAQQQLLDAATRTSAFVTARTRQGSEASSSGDFWSSASEKIARMSGFTVSISWLQTWIRHTLRH